MATRNVIELVLRIVDQASAKIKTVTGAIAGMQAVASAPSGRMSQVFANLRTGATALHASLTRLRIGIRAAFVAMTGWRTIVAVTIFGGLVKKASEFADVLRNAESRIRIVTKSQAQLAAVNDLLYQTAQKVRTPYAAIVDLYTRVARSSDQLGVSQRQVIQFTEAVSKSIVIAGSTSKEASAGMIQLGQALASGALRGDELRSVMEQMPRLAQAIAQGLGVTRGELRRMGEAGELQSQKIFKAIMSQRAVLDEEFKKVAKTVGGASVQTQNALQKLVGETLNTSGATDKLVLSLDNLTRFLESPRAKDGMANFTLLVLDLASAAAKAAGWIGDMYAKLDTSLKEDAIEGLPLFVENLEELRKALKTAEETDPSGIKKLMQDFQFSRAITGPLTMGGLREAELKGEEEFKREVVRLYRAAVADAEKERQRLVNVLRQGVTLDYKDAEGNIRPGGKLAGLTRGDPTRRGSAVAEARLRALLDEVERTASLVPPQLANDVKTKLEKIIQGTERSFESQGRVIRENIRDLSDFLNTYSKFSAEDRKKAGVTGGMMAGAGQAIKRLKTDLALINFEETFQPLGVSAKKAFDGMTDMQISWYEDTRSTLEKAVDSYREYVTKLEYLLQNGFINAATYNERYTDYLDKNLEKISVTSRKVAVKLNEMSTAGKRALENIQDVLADFLSGSTKGFKGLADAVLNVFKRIAAEAAATRLIKILNIDKLIKAAEAPFKRQAEQAAKEWFEKVSIGGPPEKPTPIPILKKSPEERAAEAIRRASDPTKQAVEKQTGELSEVIAQSNAKITEAMLKKDPCACLRQGVDRVIAAMKECCARTGDVTEGGKGASAVTEAVNKVIPRMDRAAEAAKEATDEATTASAEATEAVVVATRESSGKITEAVQKSAQVLVDTQKSVEGALGRVFHDVGKMIDLSIGNLGRYLGSIIAKMGGGGKSSFDWGSVAKIASSYFMSGGGLVPSFAGGGTIPSYASGGLVRVGEEGPELVRLPGGSQVINQRQQTYRGMNQPQLNYSPNYTIVIENAGDAKETRQQLGVLLNSRDKRLRAEIMAMMKDNGFGRMN